MSRNICLLLSIPALALLSPSCEETAPLQREVADNLRGLIRQPSDGIVLGSWRAEPESLLEPLVAAASSAYPGAQVRSRPEAGLVYFWWRRFDESPVRAVFALRRREGSAEAPVCDLVAYPLQRTAEAPLHHREIPPVEALLEEFRERARQAGALEASLEEPPAPAEGGSGAATAPPRGERDRVGTGAGPRPVSPLRRRLYGGARLAYSRASADEESSRSRETERIRSLPS